VKRVSESCPVRSENEQPCLRNTSDTTVSPSPRPECFVEKNGLKRREAVSSEISAPLLHIVNVTEPFSFSVAI